MWHENERTIHLHNLADLPRPDPLALEAQEVTTDAVYLLTHAIY